MVMCRAAEAVSHFRSEALGVPQTSTHPISENKAAVRDDISIGNSTATSQATLRPEARLLIACANIDYARDQTDTSTQDSCGVAYDISLLLEEDLDWDYLLENALRHGMEPLLYWRLKAVAPEVRQSITPEVWHEIEQSFFYNAGKNLLLTRELLKILAALAEQKIDAVPYKGPLVTGAFYPNSALRQYCDLDIFVSREDVLRARDVLRSLGFATEFAWTPAQERAHVHYEDEYVFHRAADDLTVELHWEFNARRSGSMLDTNRFWQQREAVVLNGTSVHSFAAQDLLLVLCVHGYKHFWERLAWICDIAQIIKTRPDIDWEALLLQAKSTGIERILYLGLTLAGDLLGAPLPANVAELVRRDSTTQKLAAQACDNLFPSASYCRPAPLQMLSYHAAMRERCSDRIGMAVRAAITPTWKDWSALPLPAPLFPLYYVVRPFRLLAEASIGRLRSSGGKAP
jgi:hypothetical protein